MSEAGNNDGTQAGGNNDENNAATSGAGSGRRNDAGGNRSRRQNRNNRQHRNKSQTFKGATSELNGHVFQVPTEGAPKSQFIRTIDEFAVFAAKEYKENAGLLGDLFKDLKMPSIPRPTKPDENADEVDQAGFKEEVKIWKTDEQRLKKILAALFKIIWGSVAH